MALYEKKNRMPPWLAEIPYGFKNLWQITVSSYSLADNTFAKSNITKVILNGSEINPEQVLQLYDWSRDGASLAVQNAGGIYVTLDGYDETTGLYSFTTLIQQDLTVAGVMQVYGDMVDNTDVQRPLVGHDTQKLDVSTYNANQTTLNNRLTADEANISSLQTSVNSLNTNTIQQINLNGTPVPKTGNTANITIDAITNTQLQQQLATKVDKTVAGIGGTITQDINDSFNTSTKTLTIQETKLSLETGATTTTTNNYNLVSLLGIDELLELDQQVIYLVPDSYVTSFVNVVNIPLSVLYRYNNDGSIYTPTITDTILAVFAVSQDYSTIGVPSRQYISAIGMKRSASQTTVNCTFTNYHRFAIYNRYNSYRQGVVVYDDNTGAIYYTLQNIPLPGAEAAIIPISNPSYFKPVLDNTIMPANTVWANFVDNPNPGQSYTVDQTRIELMKGVQSEYSGYDEYVEFLTDTIPTQIVNNNDWNNNISLWVTDGIVFTVLQDLLNYLSNYASPGRYKTSNRGNIKTSYSAGGITITPAFDVSYIEGRLNNSYILKVPTATSGNIAVFDNNGNIEDGGTAITGLATSAQGALADSAVQTVTIAGGSSNGSITLSVDGNDSTANVTGLQSAAYQPTTAFATYAQGIRADTSLQTATLSSGTNNGTLKLVTTTSNGTTTQDNISVTGLGTAAYENNTFFATATQGSKADTAVQSVTISSGTSNGQVRLTVDGTNTDVSVFGLGTSAYTNSTAYATAAQGALADSALQHSDVVDNTTSTDSQAPGSANQIRILSQRLDAIGSGGKPIGGFANYASRYTNTSQYASDLQPINVGDTIYISEDENHTNQSTQYAVASIDGTGNITYSFVKIIPPINRDFITDPITQQEIQDGAISTDKISNSAVTTNKIANDSVTRVKLSQLVRDSLALADNSLQSATTDISSGNVVTAVIENNKKLEIQKGYAVNNISTTGTGNFVTGGTITNNTLTLNRNGTAILDAVTTGTGNTIVAASKDINNSLQLTLGNRISGTGTDGAGNTIVNLSQVGTSIIGELGVRLSTAVKSGTGNALSNVSVDANGNATFSSDTLLKSVTTTGTGNVISSITDSAGVVTATRIQALTSVPSASTTQAGITQLVDNLTSTSITQALTANQGRQLQSNITNLDDGVVHKANSETITGTKTLTSHLITPSKTTIPVNPSPTQYATETQVSTRYGKVQNAVANNILAVDSFNNLFDTGIQYTSIAYIPITNTEIIDIVNEVWV